MTIAYSIIFAISLLLPVGHFFGVRRRQNERWLLVLYLCICVVNLGYLLLSISKTVAFALVANKIAYLGQVFIIICMFMLISKLCGFCYPKWVTYTLIGVAVAMYAMVLTTGHFDWYYKHAELIEVDGAAKLVKEYGPLHTVYLLYILTFFTAMFAVIGMSLKRNKSASPKLAGLMLVVVIGNVGMWLVEKLVTWNFEFLAVSYLMSEFVFFFVYWLLQDYIHKDAVSAPLTEGEKNAAVTVDAETTAEKMQSVLDAFVPTKTLTKRQMEMLEGILEGKSRKQIAQELHISENTVKTHTTSLYAALGVSGKEDILVLLQGK